MSVTLARSRIGPVRKASREAPASRASTTECPPPLAHASTAFGSAGTETRHHHIGQGSTTRRGSTRAHFDRRRQALRVLIEIPPPRLRRREIATRRPSRADVVHDPFARLRVAHREIVVARLLPT